MSISLMGSVRTCKVQDGWADKLQSDRFFNSNNMLCIPWNGVDTAGRPVDANSYYIKTPGCNSSSDRIMVENDQRPKYMEYIQLNAQGIRGDAQCQAFNQDSVYGDTQCHLSALQDVRKQTGQFGMVSDFSANIDPNCLSCSTAPDRNMTIGSTQMRVEAFRRNAAKNQYYQENLDFNKFRKTARN